jgi:beta-galactosidase
MFDCVDLRLPKGQASTVTFERAGLWSTSPAPIGRPPRGLAFGADYYPEQWPEDVWAQDVRLMREAGVTFATVGVFAWALLEPEEGRFTFEWLDRVLDLLEGGGIAVDLATATASPPPWLSLRYPQTLPVDAAGNRQWPGSRQAWCPSSPVFRERALALVQALAERYHGHPALAMWHVSNELGRHNARCFCDVSAEAFRRWLARRYGGVAGLNEAWGTAFSGQRHSDLDEVWPPRQTTAQPNPTQLLDFARFSSDELLDHYRAERDLLHRLSPGVPVTTNFMVTSHVDGMDYWAWAPEQDVVSQDHYLDARLEHPRHELAFCADLTRGLAGGGPWFLMEHSTSAVTWQPVNYAKAHGELARTSLAHVARGADAVGFFQWRASRAGAEKYHSALVPHAGAHSKIWREVVALGDVLSRAGDIAGTRVEAQAAVLFDWQAWWACDQGAHPSSLVRYPDQALAVHRALWSRGVSAHVLGPGADLDARLAGIRVLAIPTLYLVDDATAAAVARFAAGGGHVVVTYFSGIVDEHDHIRLGGYPGAFRDLLGITTEEFFPLAPGQVVDVEGIPGHPGVSFGRVWTERTHLDGAQAVATYTDGPVTGGAAVTRYPAGRGMAWYVGTWLDDTALAALLAEVCHEAGVAPVVAAPDGVEVVRRSGGDRSFLFVLNHTGAHARVHADGEDLVSGRAVEGTIVVPAGGCAVIREARGRPGGSAAG